MFFSVIRPIAIIITSAIIWALNTDLGVSATITQATVATNMATDMFFFTIGWSSSPNFVTTDSFKYNILNPTTANKCCSPYAGWPGFAANYSDYQLIEGIKGAGILSLYSGNDVTRSLIGSVPFTVNSSNVLTFAIAFSSLNEPNGFVYELEYYNFGGWNGNVLVGSADGNPAVVPSVPLPGALPLFASGLGALGLLGWRKKRKNVAASAAA